MDYELIIVGAGPAGLSAALNASYYRVNTLVLESGSAGGQPMSVYRWKTVDNYLGFYGLSGRQVAEKMLSHVKSEGAEIRENEVVLSFRRNDSGLIVKTSKAEYSSKALILATGLGTPRRLGVEGENLDGVMYSLKGVALYAGKNVLVVGGGDSAVEHVIALKKYNARTVIAHRQDAFRATDKNVEELLKSGAGILFNTEVRGIYGDGKVEGVELWNNKSDVVSSRAFDVVLLCLGMQSNIEFFKNSGINLDEKNNVVVDVSLRTNIEGVFAAGDVTGRWLRIPQAIGEGGYTAFNAFKYIKKPYWS